MELNHSFTVPASLADTWQTFEDIDSVAGCFPGATVTEIDGDDFKGTCKVKLGPIALVSTGTGTFLEKDEAARRFVIEAKGKDKRGNGTAGATVTATFAEEAQESTRVDVQTDLAITGKPAQFGRGVIQDVSDKLLGQFVACLEQKVGGGDPDHADPDHAEAGPAASGPLGVACVVRRVLRGVVRRRRAGPGGDGDPDPGEDLWPAGGARPARSGHRLPAGAAQGLSLAH